MQRLRTATLLALALHGCSPLVKPPASLPHGAVCDSVLIATADLKADLAGRVAGDCVVLPTGTWRGNFELPVDVSLIAGTGSAPVLKGEAAGQPVLRIHGGSRTVLQGIRIDGSQGGGLAIDPGPVAMRGVTVTGAAEAALSATCTASDCDQRAVDLEDVTLEQSHYGLLASGARVHLLHGTVRGSLGTGLTEGSGVIAANGASLSLEGVTVEDNLKAGVLLDGAATRATLDGVVVRNNLGRGVWAQGLRGAGALHVTGGAFSGNALVGLGVRDSQGLIVTGATLRDARPVQVPSGLGGFDSAGEGIGLYQRTGEVVLTDVTLTDNPRAQLLVDQAGGPVQATGTFSGGRYRAVVQRSDGGVEVPAGTLDTAPALPVVDGLVTIPR